MSVACMARVWKHSRHKGSALLLLLAIADYAHDDGLAWPSVTTLAEKTRMSPRQVARLLQKLASCPAPELVIKHRSGTSSHLVVTVGTPDKLSPPSVRNVSSSPVTGVTPRDDTGVSPPLSPVSPKPVRNQQDESKRHPSVDEDALQAGLRDLAEVDHAVVAAIEILKRLPGYPFDADEDPQLIATFHAQRPAVRIDTQLSLWNPRIDRNGEPIRNPRKALMGWLASAPDAPLADRERYCNAPGCGNRGYGERGLCMGHLRVLQATPELVTAAKNGS